jgi:triphosphoribosyl-dephospho-CoA synthase
VIILNEKANYCEWLAGLAVQALIDEVSLTPKPGLVDQLNSGSHDDLTYLMMIRSAECLKATFYEMAFEAFQQKASIELREKFGLIGRIGEEKMLHVTGGVNTHKGAIWTLGLIVAATAMHYQKSMSLTQLFNQVSELALIEDKKVLQTASNGERAIQKYGGYGAKKEAQLGLPHIRKYSYPMLTICKGTEREHWGSHYALLILMSNLNDTCILHRAGREGLQLVKLESNRLLQKQQLNEEDFLRLNDLFIKHRISPGGSADLLAATFLIASIIEEKERLDYSMIKEIYS